MIPLLTSAAIRAADRAASDRYGLPSILLMEHAGRAVADAVERLHGGPGKVVILAGKGNNGGDGFVAARWLARRGWDVNVLLAAEVDEVAGDARVNLDLWRRLGGRLATLRAADGLATFLQTVDVVVDALLGTGIGGPPRPPLDALIAALGEAGRPVVAVDLPSGVDADTGAVWEPHVRAQLTVTLGALKIGLAVTPGAVAAGRVEVVDIGLPEGTLTGWPETPGLVEAADIAALLPARRLDWHKGDAGRALVVAGSRGYGGAAALAARAAARGGAGLVTLATPEALTPHLSGHCLEVMTRPLPETDGALSPAALVDLEPALEAIDVLAVGPGLGTASGTGELLGALLRRVTVPVVLDADALNLLAREGYSPPIGGWLLTPHPGEAARLLGEPVATVQRDRLAAARALVAKYAAVVILKGARSVIAAPDGRVAVNPTGTPAMASGGVGDALCGLTAALVAQGLDLPAAALSGTWLHGRAGELAASGDSGLLASDLIDRLPAARAELAE